MHVAGWKKKKQLPLMQLRVVHQWLVVDAAFRQGKLKLSTKGTQALFFAT